eukprot:m.905189 g.905189  ORF g.905189 m.905189 type:complete len:78 (-) comp23696_c0_seq2:3006-3239(-)
MNLFGRLTAWTISTQYRSDRTDETAAVNVSVKKAWVSARTVRECTICARAHTRHSTQPQCYCHAILRFGCSGELSRN